ncbi:MAG: ABC transporter permease [Saprospiraceae bacterium]|nr:ABC transporter permease [Saprospiraceae bacterium]
MFKNHLKIAVRTLLKNKIYTLVTFLGLTIGVASALLIFRMLEFELSFNQQFTNHDRIVRVVATQESPDEGENFNVCTPIPVMDMLDEGIPQFEQMARIKEFWVTLAQPDPNGGPPLQKFNMGEFETAYFTEPEFFDIFQPLILAGDPVTALTEPNVIILTETWANKFFGSTEKAMGQELIMDNVVPVVVKGVIADFPGQSDFPIPFLSSWETLKSYREHFFFEESIHSCSSNNQVYALLHNPGQLEAVNKELKKISEELYSDRETNRTHILQPLSELHYDERFGHSGRHQISRSRLRILGIVGILILIMACFNFINLATAQATLRAKEVGVRKTLGSSRGQLIAQFMTETGLIVLGAVSLGLVVATLCQPFLQQISYVPEGLTFVGDPKIWVFLILVALLVTLLAGLYPATVLAGFQPIRALKSQALESSRGTVSLRKVLVVLQFVVAQALVIGAIITLLQLQYIRSRELGFSQDLVYTFGINTDSSSIARQDVLKSELLKIPVVEQVSYSSDAPMSGNTWMSNFGYASRPEDEEYGITLRFCDADYQKTFNLELVAGKWFEPSDTIRQGVVNMTLIQKLGIEDPQEAIGQVIRLGGSRRVEITGVSTDFHTHSLRQAHQPILLVPRKIYYWETGVKFRSGSKPAESVAAIKQAFDKVMPEQVFMGRFLDERIKQFYEDENRLAATCRGFGLLAILISCLGLFGLAAHAAQQRVKEIGVRKVLGASTLGIVGLLSKDFLKLVILALVLAAPIAWYFMKNWLDSFAYRIDIEWWVFAITGILALFIAFLTISYQSFRAALANPIESLKSE